MPDRGERIYEAVEDIDEVPKSKKLSTLEMFGKTGSVLRALWADMPEVGLQGHSPHKVTTKKHSMNELNMSQITPNNMRKVVGS